MAWKLVLFMLVVFTQLAAAVAIKQVGAGVTWVPYQNRSDFSVDQLLLNNILGDTKSERGPDPVFNIPRERMFNTDAYSGSIESSLSLAVKSLIDQVSKNRNQDAFLVIGIASHGGDGFLCQQFGNDVSLFELSRIMLKQQQVFYEMTGKPLRLEIIYSACYSGSLIPEIKRRIQYNHAGGLAGEEVGTVSVITSTTDDSLTVADRHDGDYMLQMLLHLAEGARIASAGAPFARFKPTIAEYGFFNYLGAGGGNHPQVYSSQYVYEQKNVIKFLNWYQKSKVSIGNAGNVLRSGGDLFRRNLNIDTSDELSQVQTLAEANEILNFQTWNVDWQKNISVYQPNLKHQNKVVRYAAAIAILRIINYDSMMKATVPAPSDIRQLAEDQLVEFSESADYEKIVGDQNKSFFVWDSYLTNMPSSKRHSAVTFKAAMKMYKEDPQGSIRPVIDKLRMVFKDAYGLQEAKGAFGNFKGDLPNRLPLENIPREMLEAFVRVYFSLPADVIGGENLMNAVVAKHGNSRSVRPFVFYCQKILTAGAGDELFLSFASEVIRRFDDGIVLGFQLLNQ